MCVRYFESCVARWIFAALMLGAIAGCGSHILLGAFDEDAGAPDAPGARPDGAATADTGAPSDSGISELCTDYANQFCAVEQSCNILFFRNTWWGDAAVCRERRKIRCELRLSAPGSNDTAARVSTCMSTLAKLSCDAYTDLESWLDNCEVPPGNLADGAPCGEAAQCRGGGCFPPDNSLCGVCSTLSPLGAPCNASCLSTLQCINGTCVAFLREGDACRFGGPLCAFGLACIGAGSGQGKCGKRLGIGVACDPSAFECNDSQGLSCDGATSRCQMDPGFPAPGASCRVGQLCRADAWCNTSTNRCEAKRREGEACGNAAASAVCLPPATCVGSVCTLPNPSGCR